MNILFLCVANSARSQMAEGLALKIFGPSHTIQSAGSKPTHVSSHAIEVLKEIGIDISEQTSKAVEMVDPKSVDLVITLCEEEVCPTFLGSTKRIHWPLPDPARVSIAEPIDRLREFRVTRDKIKKNLENLSRDLDIKKNQD